MRATGSGRLTVLLPAPAPGGQLVDRQRTELAQQVGDPFGVGASPSPWSEPLQLGVDPRQDLLVQQIGRVVADQRGEGVGIQGQQVGAALGARQVLLVEQGGRVAEEERAGEGRGRRGRSIDEAHRPRGDPPHEIGQGGQVVDVLEALARRLHQDGEVAELASGLEEPTGRDALEPQGCAPSGTRHRHEQGASGALAEAGGEQGRAVDPRAHEAGQLLGVEDDELASERTIPRAGPPAARPAVLEGRHLEDDPVVGDDDLRGEVEQLLHALADRHGPRLVDAPPVGAVENDPQAAALVLVPLQHEGGVSGDDAGGGPLLAQQGDEVGPGVRVQSGGGQAVQEGGRRAGPGGEPGSGYRGGRGGGRSGAGRRSVAQTRGGLAQEGAPGGACSGGAPGPVAPPEGQAGAAAGGGVDDDAVGTDLAHPPARGPQSDDVADGGLVDHLLVELAHAAPSAVLGALGQDDGEHAAVGDGPGGGDGQALGAGAGGERAGVPVPHEARGEAGEVRGGVAAGEQLQDGVVGDARQLPVGGGSADGGVPVVDVQVLDARRRDGLLGEDVQGVGDQRGALDGARAHALGGDGGVDELGALDRVDDAVRPPADAVVGAAHALQSGGDRGRGRDLEDQVDGAHVDAQLEGGGGDHAAQPPGLQLALDGEALLLGDGPVVGPGDDGGVGRQGLSALGLAHLPGLVVAGGRGGLGLGLGTSGLRRGAGGPGCRAGSPRCRPNGLRRGLGGPRRRGARPMGVRGAGRPRIARRPTGSGTRAGPGPGPGLGVGARPGPGADPSGDAHGVGLVEMSGQSLAGSAGVDEDEGGAVSEHLVEDRLLDVRPDGGRRPGGAPAPRPRGLAADRARRGEAVRIGAARAASPACLIGASRAARVITGRLHRPPEISAARAAVGTGAQQRRGRAAHAAGTVNPVDAIRSPSEGLTQSAVRAPRPRVVAPARAPATLLTDGVGGPGESPVHAGAPVRGGRHPGHVDDGHGHGHLRCRAPVVGDDGDGAGSAEEAGDLLARGDGRGQADALGRPFEEVVEALQGQRQVGAALGGGEGVDLIDDDGLDGAQRPPHGGGEHEVEGFRRRDEDVRRAGAQTTALGGGSIARAHAHAHRNDRCSELRGGLGDPGQRTSQVPLDVDAQGLERGYVQHPHTAAAVAGRAPVPGRAATGRWVPDEPIDGGQEGGQRLARTGGRDDQRVLATVDGRPGALLDRRRAVREDGAEPGPGRGGEGIREPRGCDRFGGHAPSMAGVPARIAGRDGTGGIHLARNRRSLPASSPAQIQRTSARAEPALRRHRSRNRGAEVRPMGRVGPCPGSTCPSGRNARPDRPRRRRPVPQSTGMTSTKRRSSPVRAAGIRASRVASRAPERAARPTRWKSVI